MNTKHNRTINVYLSQVLLPPPLLAVRDAPGAADAVHQTLNIQQLVDIIILSINT